MILKIFGLNREELSFAYDVLQKLEIECDFTEDGLGLIVSQDHFEDATMVVVYAVLHVQAEEDADAEKALIEVMDKMDVPRIVYASTLRHVAACMAVLFIYRKAIDAKHSTVRKEIEKILESCTDYQFAQEEMLDYLNASISSNSEIMLPWVAGRLFQLASANNAGKRDYQFELAKDKYVKIVVISEKLVDSDVIETEKDKADIELCKALSEAVRAGGRWKSSLLLYMKLSSILARLENKASQEARREVRKLVEAVDAFGEEIPEMPEDLPIQTATQKAKDKTR